MNALRRTKNRRQKRCGSGGGGGVLISFLFEIK
jgi:hypothetical protein